MIDVTKEVIKIKLTSPTGEVRETKVYTKFASDARARTVQAICDLIGGAVVYFRFKSDSGKSYTTVPVHDRRSPSMTGGSRSSYTGNLGVLGLLFDERESTMTVFGESRVEWTLATESLDESGTELDYGPEHSDDPSLPGDSAKDGNLAAEFF
jgi:hypothetical protein